MGIAGVQAQARLGRYELLARLATGGMGEIFLARLEGAAGFEKLYVVKRILPHLADDARFRQMLISEAQIAAKMAHANICQVYELGETQGQLYIVMEYLEGVTMLPLLRRSSKAGTHLEFGFVAGVIAQTCDALHYAHDLKDRNGDPLGLVHRDISPGNVFLTESGIVKVLDFGIAKAKGASSTKTEDGAVKGKYAYMAPEQLRGGAIDRRVDLFALGVVLYEMLALRRLFQRKTDYLTFRAVMEQPIPDIRRYRPDVPDGIADALARALDRDPAVRFESARQFAGAILDGITAVQLRPWTQGDISDFVKAHFADELGRRSQQVATAVHKTASGVQSQRATMPLIAHDDATHEDDDDGFPSVETDIDSSPRFVAAGDRPNTDPFNSSTPPPFASVGESTGSAPSLQPLRGNTPVSPATQSSPVVVVGQRSLVWPILAVAMIGIAGAALFLVWKQMQNQQPQQPAVINLTQEKDDHPAPVVPPPTPDGSADQGGSAVASGSDVRPPDLGTHADPKHGGKSPKPKFATYDQALAAQKPAMVQCLMDHRDGGIPNEAITAVISISANGRAKSVQLRPAALNAAPLGGCIRNVLMGAAFPSAPIDNTITVPLKPKST
jgi:eukaryotic-like serine/threonine-protein kinase